MTETQIAEVDEAFRAFTVATDGKRWSERYQYEMHPTVFFFVLVRDGRLGEFPEAVEYARIITELTRCPSV